MTRITWAPAAQANLDELHDFYSGIAPELADHVSREAVAAARFLAAHPYAGEQMSIQGIRKWSVRRVPLIILYEPKPDGIEIIKLAHVREDWKSAFR